MASSPQPEPVAPRVVDDADADAGLALDRETVVLRSAGTSYAAIARRLGLPDARHAHDAFTREVRRRPAEERAALRDAEAARLETLAGRTQARTDLDAGQVAKRLRAIERLRQTLMMD